VREVVPIRLGADERRQIAGAAARLGVTVSGFVREAALEASARVVQKVVAVRIPELPDRKREAEVVFVDAGPKREHWVDGERIR
jgi:uncharacterized protein (DUF1778 family)